ncbi:hypothetical protein [Streptomyces natalensis]|uniref:Heparin-binding hemagglutinin n=1 Tax=Streptomyces natalensis ATCC 27448 TaxID=1240678 RepID=A0A0D7CBY6_9ACTN|nr:hypothetical protein [Streptomyces natalensis]KIZ13773.1 hypothetical protein SNA_37890 [Streptomyces natalensis ATCC 27448]
MPITDDLRKTLTDATPLYAAAGAVDLAAEKLGEVPTLVEKIRVEAPKRFESVRATDPKEVQDRFAKGAKEVQEKVTELVGSLDGDLKRLRDQAQEAALQGVGRAAETAVWMRERYDELAERGRGAVQTWRGQTADHFEELAVAIEPEPAAKSEPQSQSTVNHSTVNHDASKQETGTANGAKAADGKAAGSKKTAPAARKPVAKKTTPPAAK